MDWERQTHALLGVLAEKGLLVTDELRRGIESIPPDQYESLSYYERWAASLEGLLVEKGILTTDEIDGKVRALEHRLGVELVHREQWAIPARRPRSGAAGLPGRP